MIITADKIKDFIDLETWKHGHQLVLLLYLLTKKFPKEELFGITSQLRRASVSITSNIAEGFGRNTYKERVHFYFMARGSLCELKNQLMISRDLNYLSIEDCEKILFELENTHRLLQGLINKTKSFSRL